MTANHLRLKLPCKLSAQNWQRPASARACCILTIVLFANSAIAGSKDETSSHPGGKFSEPAEVWTQPDSKSAQTPSPDGGALSVLYNDLSARAETSASESAITRVSVPISPYHATHLVVDLRGSMTKNGRGTCRVSLMSAKGHTAIQVIEPNIRLRLRLAISKDDTELLLVATMLCQHPRSASSAVLGTIDSLDLGWDHDSP